MFDQLHTQEATETGFKEPVSYEASYHKELLGDVCVLGLGKTGVVVATYLAKRLGSRVNSVCVYGGASSFAGPATKELEELGVKVVLGTEDLAENYDLAVVSPGIPQSSHFVQSAREHAKEVIGEPEFAWRESPARWIGITGTNGKTTTTTLETQLLSSAGFGAKAVGNIGTVATGELDTREEGSWFVAELSSFQLAGTFDFHPRVACLLNLTPDHVEWHGSLEAYAAAKERIFANLTADDLAVISNEDEWCRAIAQRLKGRNLRSCIVNVHEDPQSPCAAFPREGRLVVRLDGQEHELVLVDSLPIKGEHNVQNALAACAMALELGVSDAAVCHALLAFNPLEHRIEPCGELDGVHFVNDSKATNTDAVEKALTAFVPGHIVVLLGGHDKGTNLDSMARAVTARCKAAICYGDAGPRIAQALKVAGHDMGLEVLEAPHMKEALKEACKLAKAQDTVLLSPACSSFDEFKSFEERGRVFKELVAKYCLTAQGQVETPLEAKE